jgi:galactokinase
MQVPTATSLKDIYPADALEVQTRRWEHLLQTFKSEYGQQADFVSRSPGRVNLIGEVSLFFMFRTSADLVSYVCFENEQALLVHDVLITNALVY